MDSITRKASSYYQTKVSPNRSDRPDCSSILTKLNFPPGGIQGLGEKVFRISKLNQNFEITAGCIGEGSREIKSKVSVSVIKSPN